MVKHAIVQIFCGGRRQTDLDLYLKIERREERKTMKENSCFSEKRKKRTHIKVWGLETI